MIARIWRGLTAADRADAYVEYFNDTGLKDFSSTPGNRGVYVIRRTIGDRCEFQIISLWDSMDAIQKFAGADAERSRYYPEDEQFLLEMEPLVRHFEVAEALADPLGGTKR
jgi:heme-degrading monooxygenase HmoA